MSAPAETLTIPTTRAEKRDALAEATSMIPADLVPMNSPMATILNPVLYKHLMTVAAQFATTQLIPKHFQDKPQDVFVALHMAHRMGCDPILVLQNLYVVHGMPGWKSSFIIAQANMAKAFASPIRWRVEKRGEPIAIKRKKTSWDNGQKRTTEVNAVVPDIAVTAYAADKTTGEELAVEVTMQQAIAEGWTDNEKYSSLGEQMLRYRSAAFLVRLYAPQVMLGVPVVDELEDVEGVAAPAAPAEPAMRTYDAASLNDMLKPKVAVTQPSPAAPAVDLTIHDDPSPPAAAPENEHAPDPAPPAAPAETYDGPSYAELITMIEKATTADRLDEIRDLARGLPDATMRTSVGQKARARLKVLQGEQQ